MLLIVHVTHNTPCFYAASCGDKSLLITYSQCVAVYCMFYMFHTVTLLGWLCYAVFVVLSLSTLLYIVY